MNIALVISTIGRPDRLERLLESLVEQHQPPTEIVVADQSTRDDTRQVVRRWAADLPVRRVASSKGLSVGRNDGIVALRSDWEAIGFPDDDVAYPVDTLARAASALADLDGVTGRLIDDSGANRRLAFGDAPVPITRRNVWVRAIEATMFLRRPVIDQTGPFDPTIGAGAATPWQSGEGTDLLLRAIESGARIAYRPDVTVIDNPVDQGAVSLSKVRAYARGTGVVMRRHYSRPRCAVIVAKPLVGALLEAARRNPTASRRHLQAVIGRAEGIIGRTTDFLSPGREE